MAKTEEEFLLKLSTYCREFGNSLSIIGNQLYCKACNKRINNPYKKYQVRQHLATKLHINSIKVFNDNKHMSEDLEEELLLNNSSDELRKRSLLLKYIREFGDVFTCDENKLFCKICQKEIINPFKKSTVGRHLANKSHIRAVKNSFFGNDFKEEFSEEDMELSNESIDERHEQVFDEELETENKLIKEDLNSELSLISVLELIKDKVNKILNECKCVYNNSDKNEVKLLIEEYDRRKTQFICNKSIDNNNSNGRVSNNLNKKSDIKNNFDKNIKKDIKIKSRRTINSINRRNKKLSSVKSRLKNKSNDELNSLLNEDNLSSDKRYVCSWPGCDRRYHLKSQLRPHLRIHTGEKKLFKCHYSGCNKTYDRRSALDYHILKHKYKGYKHPKTVVCEWPECELKFANKGQMNKHMRVKHLKVVMFRCEWPECGLGFVNSFEYDKHVGEAHVGHKLYKCEYKDCGKDFVTKYNRQKHYNYIHLKLKPYKCGFENCGDLFKSKELLNSHMNEDHNGLKPYACDWPGCEFSTLHSKTLMTHKRRHTGERPFKCSWPQCEWSFRQMNHLKTHMLKHTGERPVVCDDLNCNERFQTRHAMKVHFQRTHTFSDKF